MSEQRTQPIKNEALSSRISIFVIFMWDSFLFLLRLFGVFLGKVLENGDFFSDFLGNHEELESSDEVAVVVGY